MKRFLFFFMLAGSLLAFSQNSVAQKNSVTAATATKKNGYTILNAGEKVVLYKYEHKAHAPKQADKYPITYFFTTGDSDVLQPLTKTNLKKAFPQNHPFHDALDQTFKDDGELTAYDSFHKMYKVNWVLKNHL